MLAHAKDSGYAWIIVLQGFIGSSLSDGGVFAFGIFLPFYVVSLKSSAGSVALIGSLANGTSLAISPLTGWLTDTYGPRKVLFMGAILSSLGFYTASLSTTLWELLLTQGLLVGVGASCAYVASQAAIGHWFNERRGLAMGLSGSGTGFGSLFFVLIVNALLSSNGLPYALQIIALFELIGLLLATCLVCRFEEATAQSISINPVSPSTPPGIEVSTFSTDTQIVSIDKPCTGAVHDNADDATATNDHREQDEIESKLRPKSIWKSKKFIYLLIAFGVLSFGDTVPLIFLPLYAQSLGISVTQSNHLVAILGIGSGFGRIIIGYFADKFSKLWLLLLSLSICGILTLGWLGYDNYSALVLYAFFFGVFFGAYNILVGPISLELFGPAELGQVMGWLLAVQAIGCLSAGPIAGVLYDIDQSFMPMIIYSSVTLLLSVVFVDLASKSVSVVNVSNPYDFNHRQGSSLAISSRSSEKLLVDKSMSIRMPVESTAEAVTTSRTHFSMIHYLWSIQLRWSCAETKVFPPTTDAVDVTENEKF